MQAISICKSLKTKKIAISSISLLLFIVASCSSDETNEMETPSNVVTYTGDVKAIMEAKYMTSHGDPLIDSAPMPLLTLANVKEAVENRNLIGRVEDGTMSPGNAPNLTAAQIQAIKDWQTKNFTE